MSAALQNSLIFRLAVLLGGYFQDSFISRMLDKIGDGAPRWFSGSAVAQIVRRDGAVTRAWSGSLLAKALSGFVNLPVAVARFIYRRLKGVLEGSIVWRLAAWIGQHTLMATGLFLIVMLYVPHWKWNNLYGFLGALTLGALFIIASGRGKLHFEISRLGPWFALFLLSIVSALITSWSTPLSLRFFLFYVGAFLFTLLIVSAVRRTEQLMNFLTALAVGLLLCGTYGVRQMINGVAIVYSQQDMTLNQGMPGRVYSYFDNPNNFAEVLVILLPLVLALLLCTKKRWVRLLCVAALGVGVVSLGATYGRTCWIGFVIAMMVFLFLLNWKFLPLAILAGILCLPLLPTTIFNRILTIGNTNDTSLIYRFYIYDASFTMLKDFWFRGTGLGTDAMGRVFRLYPPMKDGNFPLHTHNNYLQMWGELGIMGGVFHLGTMLGQVKSGVKGYYAAPEDRTLKLVLAAATGALCGILVVGLAEYTWYYPRNLFFFWTLFGVITACLKLMSMERRLA